MVIAVLIVLVVGWMSAVAVSGQEATVEPTPERLTPHETEVFPAPVVLPPDEEALLEQQINEQLTESLVSVAETTANTWSQSLREIVVGIVALAMAAFLAVYRSVPPDIARGLATTVDKQLEALKGVDILPGKVDDALIHYINEKFDAMMARLENSTPTPAEAGLTRRTAIAVNPFQSDSQAFRPNVDEPALG
jgi:hypothetical protein